MAAAGDRTLTGDALFLDTASDSGLGKPTVSARPPSPPPQPSTNLVPPPANSQKPTTSVRKPREMKRGKAVRQKKDAARRGKQKKPAKFTPAAERRRPQTKQRRSSTVASKTPPASATGDTAAGPGKRPPGRPRKHPVVPVPEPPRSVPVVRQRAPDAAVKRRQFADVESSDSSDSDVIVTGYVAPRHVTTASCRAASADGRRRNEISAAVAMVAADSRKRNETAAAAAAVVVRSSQRGRTSVEQDTEPTPQQPVKRKRGRPRKNPLPPNPVAVGSSSTVAAVERQAATDDGGQGTIDRRRVTRALTAVQLQQEWNASRSAADSNSATPARNAPPLYLELSSSDSEQPPPCDVDRCQMTQRRRKRRRRRSIPSRSLELSFSSIEKDGDVSGGEGLRDRRQTSGRSRDRAAAAEMTSTPRYDRSTSTRDSTLRSRWINVDHRATDTTTTTTTAVVHRDFDGRQPASSANRVLQSNVDRTPIEPRQSPGLAAVHHSRRGRRRRPSENEDPDWRRCGVAKQTRRQSRGPPSAPTGSTMPVTTSSYSGGGGYDSPTYDDAELDVLLELQRRLASTTDGSVLRQVVEIIEKSGRYHVEDATFDFDLCSLDRGTIAKLRRCLAV